MPNITTTMRSYYFDTRKPAEAEAYRELSERLTAQGLDCFETWGGGGSHYDARFADGLTIELETEHLFSNQWNTAPIAGIRGSGLRVFDWAQDYPMHFDARIKRGHYLEQTPEMAAVRTSTLTCGYCGKHEPAASGAEFCGACLDSAYLKESDLHLQRLVPAAVRMLKREPLTPAERAVRVPLYVAAQVSGDAVRAAAHNVKRRKRVEIEYAEDLEKAESVRACAETKRDGFTWLLDRGINTENVIFYNHTGRFGFGWCSPIEGAARLALLEALRTFPFPYDVETKKRY